MNHAQSTIILFQPNSWETAKKSGHEFQTEQELIPVRPEVRSLCEILGPNPLHMSNEGTVLMIVETSSTGDILSALRGHKPTTFPQVVGEVREDKFRVIMKTQIGGTKIIQVPYGEPIQRVC
ncbi:MAG: hypothetical protein ACFFEF_18110 [Candidatus Thorarchaeota archaeon]